MDQTPDRSSSNQSHSVHRIVLPSGRKIEVVRFHDDPAADRRPLHICPDCASDLVQPRCWNEATEQRWELTLECPNCGWTEAGVYDRDEIDRLEERLDDGLAEMLADLQRLTQANMADEIDRFVQALDANLVLPEDF